LEKNDGLEGYRWVILTIVYLSILAFTFIFQSIPPVLPLMISELRLTYAQSGLLMSLFALPGLLISLPGGYLSDRYPMKPLGAGCFILMVGGILLVGLGRDLRVLWLGRGIAGIGGLTLSILLPKLLSQWFQKKELGLAMGIFNTGVPLGSVLCFGLFGKIGNLWGWRIPILLTGIYSLITAILLLSFYQLPSSQTLENRKQEGLCQSVKEMGSPIWWVGVSWLWFNAAFVSFATFAPSFFFQKGFTIEQSGFLTGIPLLGSLFLSPLMGYLVDRFRHQGWLIAIGGIGLSVLMLSFNFSLSFFLLVTLMGIFSAMIPAPIYSFPPGLLRPDNLGLGFGVISTCSSIGLSLGPYFVGKAKDLTDSDGFTFAIISFFFLLTAISIFFVHRRPKQTPKKP
jgi:predicted MFS family arabinose efflux permease